MKKKKTAATMSKLVFATILALYSLPSTGHAAREAGGRAALMTESGAKVSWALSALLGSR